jgi:hypothetical protein
MAHANASTASKIHKKKLREQNAKKRHVLEAMEPEERVALIKARTHRPLKGRVKTALWDLKHGQYPLVKLSLLRALLKDRLEEIKTEDLVDEEEVKEISEALKNMR